MAEQKHTENPPPPLPIANLANPAKPLVPPGIADYASHAKLANPTRTRLQIAPRTTRYGRHHHN